jgi:hypothetical protein
MVQEHASLDASPRFSCVLFLGWPLSILSRICEEVRIRRRTCVESTGALLAVEPSMTKVYYSTTFAQTADKVWEVIGDFNGFQWAEGVGLSHIENRKPNNAVGAIRDYKYRDHVIRERLVAHSDADTCYTYESVDPLDTLRSYRQTLRVAPIVDTGTAFVEWTTEFAASAEEQERWRKFLMDESAKSLEKLRTYLAEQ